MKANSQNAFDTQMTSQRGKTMQTNSTQRGETMKKVIFSFLSVACATSLVYGAPSDAASPDKSRAAAGVNFNENSGISLNESVNEADKRDKFGRNLPQENAAENSAENLNGVNLNANSVENSGLNSSGGANSVNLSANFAQNALLPGVQKFSAAEFKQLNADDFERALKGAQGAWIIERTGADPVSRLFVRGRENKGYFIDGVSLRDFYDDSNYLEFLTTKGVAGATLYKGFVPVGLGGFSALNLTSAKPQSTLEAQLGFKIFFNNVGIQDSTDAKLGEGKQEMHKYLSVGTRQGDFWFSALYFDSSRNDKGFSKDYEGTLESMRKRSINGRFENRTIKLGVGYEPAGTSDEYALHYINQKGAKGNLVPDNASTSTAYSEGDAYTNTNFTGYGGGTEYPVWDNQLVYFVGKSYFTPNFSLDSQLFFQSINKKQIQIRLANLVQDLKSDNYDYNSLSYGGMLALKYDFSENLGVKFGVKVKENDTDNEFSNEYSWSGGTDSRLSFFYAKELQSSVFAEFNAKVADFGFLLGVSYDRSDVLKAKVRQMTTAKSTSTLPVWGDYVNGLKHSMRIGFANFALQGLVDYDISENQKLYLSVSKKNEFPSLYERYCGVFGCDLSSGVANTVFSANSSLQPESLLNYELGYALNLPSTKFNVSLFYEDLLGVLSVKNSSYELTTENDGYTYGGELGVEQGIMNGVWVFGANYSFLQGWRKANDGVGHKITYYPHHIANAKIAFKPTSIIELIALGTYTSREKVPTDTGYKYGREYFSFDLMANFSFIKGLSFNAGIYNVTDRDNYLTRYNASYTKAVGTYHLSGRRYFIGFDYKYQK